MRKSRWLSRRRAAGVMAAVVLAGALPTSMTGLAQPVLELQDGTKVTATEGNAQKATPGNATRKLAKEQQSEGTTYYVDAVNGNDEADGKTEETAWKSFDRVNAKTFLPGDKILLKADCVWNQTLKPKGSGRDGAPITIDMYGDGARPIINGNGTSGPTITGAVTIYNEEYWEIYNLEVTNLESTDKAGEAMDSGTAERAGILIYSSNQEQIYKHIVVKSCYVHDVNSKLSGMKNSGGILVIGHYLDEDGNRVTIDDNGNLTAKAMGRAAFEDVLIEGNYVKNVAIEGIRNKCNTDINGSGWGKNEFLKNYKNVTIRNNYLQDVAGDGIVLTETVGGLVEGNMVNASCGMDRGKTNYAQCWTMFSDDIVVQYNEAYGNKYGYDDGEAFDSDMKNENNIFQYNLSHDCGGGAMLFMSSQNNTTFRYNISINDGTGTYPNGTYLHQQIFHYDNTSSLGSNVGKIYNNTIVLYGEGKKTALFGGSAKKNCVIDFKNNIVLAADGAEITFGVSQNASHKSTILDASTIENNCFYPASIADTTYGSILDQESLEEKGNIFEDPKLVNYKASDEEGYVNFVYPLDALDELADSDFTRDRIRELAEPYQLTADSPCIQAGQRIEGMPTEDLMGNTIAGRVDIGALEFSTEDETAESVEEVNMVTTLGTLPDLPDTLDVVLEEESYHYPVEWEELDVEDFKEAGVVEVFGMLPGLSNTVIATIVVADAPESFETVEVSTYAGIYPQLPETVKAVFAEGLTLELAVEWEEIALSQYAQAGSFPVKGKVNGLSELCEATVTVIGMMGEGKTTEEVIVTKDAYTQEGNPTTAYGDTDQATLKVKTVVPAPSTYTRQAFLEFDLAAQSELLQTASKIVLRLEMTRRGSDAGFYLKVYETGTVWEEKALTWKTMPDAADDKLVIEDKRILYQDVEKQDNILELDVTEYVKKAYAEDGQTTFAFRMVTDYYGEFGNGDNGGIDFASKEAEGKLQPTMLISDIYEKSVEEVIVSTPAGKAPKLPSEVTVSYSDDSEKSVTVEWNDFDAANYESEGSFVVYGKADGISLPIRCTVNVTEGLAKVVSVKELQPIIQLTGTAWEDLGLPETVTVLLNNGKEAEVGIEYWFPDNAYDAEKVFSYTCIGYLALSEQESMENPQSIFATVVVNIIEPEDKNALIALYTEAATLINEGKLSELTETARANFQKAFSQVAAVLVNDKASEKEIHEAYTQLMQALWDLEKEENLKPNTDELRDLILIAESKDKKYYTEESYEAMKDALKEAKAVYKNNDLTIADQGVVDEAYAALKEAVDALEPKGTEPETGKIMTGIQIRSLPDKTEYVVGEMFVSKGLRVSAVYDDGSEKSISGYELSDVDMSTAGKKTVTVTYRVAINDAIRVFAESFQITVKATETTEPEEPEKPTEPEKEDDNPTSSERRYGGSARADRTIVVSEETAGRWLKNGSNWHFQRLDGSYVTNAWAKVNGLWYHFDAQCNMQTGWIVDAGKWYQLRADGSMVTGWYQDDKDGHWYYLSPDGSMQLGWIRIDGKWYYLNPVSQGQTGWQQKEDGSWQMGTAAEGNRPYGSLYVNETTPDGYPVDVNGAMK